MRPNPLSIITLVSAGQHPTSGRQRRADQDARALELGLQLAQKNSSILKALHCGDAHEPSLRQYLGMGAVEMTVLQQPPESDTMPALSCYLAKANADLILTGMRAESGESSGMLPYLLAQQLDIPIINGIAEILSISDGKAELLQALPRGQRRKISVNLPCIATVDSAASTPRQSAFGPGQRATLIVTPVSETPDTLFKHGDVSLAKPRPKRMKIVKAKTAAQRFKAATAKPEQQGGQQLTGTDYDQMADAIVTLLEAEGVLNHT